MGLHRQSAAFGLSVLAMCCFALFPVTLSAQKQSTEVVGWVIDAFTRKSIPEETQVALLEPDSTVMKVSTCDRDGRFSLMVPIQPSGAFILRFTCKGYQTAYKPVKVIWRKKKTSLSLGLITMRQLSDMADRQLGEATITATKIKFYTKNDTLVFNASAFQLQEGSMLDGLIAQLPGVEMKPDGRIFVKGRYVESLLLNGKDFFKGDNTVLLDNLPAYMVQQVQVYEKESEMSKLAGRKVDSGKYVMDVKLKRQYAIGWLANTEWGYGTENRYLGRLFAMRYTPQSRVSAFGNLNNVNSRRKPDGSGGWGDFDPSGGLTATKRAGLDYNVYDKRERFEASGSVDVSFSDNDNVWGGTVTDFLAGGDTYESRQGSAHGSNLSVSTSHTYKYKGLGNSFSLSPRFNYYKNDNQSAYRNGMFSVQPLTEYEALIDSLFSPNWATAVGNLIKRNGEWRRLQGHGSGGGAGFWAYRKMPYSSDGLTVEGDVSYSSSRSTEFNHLTYNWFDNGTVQSDHRNRYNTSPTDNFSYWAFLKYFWHLNSYSMLNPRYRLSYSHSSGDRLRYSIGTETDDSSLDWLPSQLEALMASPDAGNSYSDRLNRYRHELMLDWQWYRTYKDGQGQNSSQWFIQVKPAIVVEKNSYRYAATQVTDISKTYALPSLAASLSHNTRGYRHRINASLSLSTSSPDMLSLIDRKSDYDPTNVTLGNPGLKRRADLNTNFNYQSDKWLQDKGRLLYGNAGLNASRNAVASRNEFDRLTGVRTNQPVNVNGNWNAWVSLGFNTPLDRKRKLTLSANTRFDRYRMVDYWNSGNEATAARTVTDTRYASGTLKIDYRYNRLTVGVSGNAGYSHATASRPDFKDADTWNIRYGGHAIADLPWKMQLSTDLTMFSRRGYESSGTNADDLVWNARLSKSVLSGRLTFMVDAWDILGNLSNVSTNVNSLYRWEYFYNVIPSYALLRVVYRLDLQPKKKQ